MAEQNKFLTYQLKDQAYCAVLDLIQRIAKEKEQGGHQLQQCEALRGK